MNDAEGSMKRTIVVLASIFALLICAVVATAGPTIRIKAEVPFNFYVGEERLPAGNYIFEMRPIGFGASSSSAVAVYYPDGTIFTMIPTMPAGYDYHSSEAQLHFRRYGNAYFLAKVEASQAGASLRTAKAEREYMASTKISQDVVLMALDLNEKAVTDGKTHRQLKPRLIVQ
jgi:hypothetical protein